MGAARPEVHETYRYFAQGARDAIAKRDFMVERYATKQR